MDHWTISVDADGLALACFDMAGRSVNTLDEDVVRELEGICRRICEDDAIKGLVIASAKAGVFCAGGEMSGLDAHAGPDPSGDLASAYGSDLEWLAPQHAIFRRLETSGKPVACAIEGGALGGGLELALACHYRVTTDDAKVKLGFPEVNVGLMPGGGGTQRLPRVVGVQQALTLLLSGKPVDAAKARAMTLVDELAPPGQAIEAAKRWLREAGDPIQPWDKKAFKIPGGAPHAPGVSDIIAGATAMTRKQTFGNYPAQDNILSAVYEGTQLPIDAALRVEMRYFIKTLRSPQAKAMLRSLFVSPRQLAAGGNRPPGAPVAVISKVTVVGAGLMGSGIAYVQASAGIDTVLLDTNLENAERGKAYARKASAKAVARGQMSEAAADRLLQKISPTLDYSDVAGSDLVIEAVFEDRAIKAEVTRRAEAEMSDEAVMASNTSTLPISGLATVSGRPGNFIGLHFFSPVERMGLVEIIRGRDTSDATLAKAIDYVTKIRKTPIVVKDSRGFYTSRTITRYLDEPCHMLVEGIAPAIIENIGLMTGMPMAPFALADAIGLELPYHVREQTKADLGDAFEHTVVDDVLQALVVDHARFGRKTAKGFYDYEEETQNRRLWPGLATMTKAAVVNTVDDDLKQAFKDRLLFSMSLEAALCIEEGVIADPREADVGALMAFGFPAWTGGPLSLIDQVGIETFVARCDDLAERYGERLRPGAMLRDMAARRRGFYA